LDVAADAVVLDRGRVALSGRSEEIRSDPRLLQYLAP
jgi:branched-chain amino acid transport system ATP-binding protein